MGSYETLARVYDYLVPDAMVAPDGAVAPFASLIGTLDSGARVLDCACGTGHVAVGLARRGFDVTATDISPAMIEATRGLAERHGVTLTSAVCDWEGLPGRGWHQAFDAVFCVGNSLTHAEGTAGRRKALAAMASVLRASGLLVLTSRNWELVRRAGSGLRVGNRLVERGGVPGLPIRGWTIPSGWDEPHFLDVAVARLHGAEVTTWGERLTFWPFRHGQLDDDVRSAGLVPLSSTYSPDSDRYMVTAARRG